MPGRVMGTLPRAPPARRVGARTSPAGRGEARGAPRRQAASSAGRGEARGVPRRQAPSSAGRGEAQAVPRRPAPSSADPPEAQAGPQRQAPSSADPPEAEPAPQRQAPSSAGPPEAEPAPRRQAPSSASPPEAEAAPERRWAHSLSGSSTAGGPVGGSSEPSACAPAGSGTGPTPGPCEPTTVRPASAIPAWTLIVVWPTPDGVAGAQPRGSGDAHAVDVRAVGRVEIGDLDAAVGRAADPGVLARELGVATEAAGAGLGTAEDERVAEANRCRPRHRARRARVSWGIDGDRRTIGGRACANPAATYAPRPMTWEPELEELRRREALAAAMGGEDRWRASARRGKLTVRERIELLVDEGTWRETGMLAGSGAYGDDGTLRTSRRRTSSSARAHGRPPRDRPGRRLHRPRRRRRRVDLGEGVWPEKAANELRLPLVRLVDGTGGGGSVKGWTTWGSPTSAAAGRGAVVRQPGQGAGRGRRARPCAGLGAARVVMSHFSVIPKGPASCSSPARPSSPAMNEQLDKEELGGARMQTRAGAVDNEAVDEEDAIAQLKRFLSYLPDNVWEAPPIAATHRPGRPPRGGAARDRPARPAQDLQDAPHPRAGLRPRVGVRARRRFGRSLITALARLDGRPVGVLASDPSTTAAA